jgi:DNA repair protein RecO (recombination protein O)
MFTRYKTRALLLKEEARGEGDVLLTFFSEDFGKLEILARSLRKIKSKLRADLELFSLIQLEYIQGRHYKTLTDAEKIKSCQGLKKSPAKLIIAFHISRTIDSLVENQEEDERIWQLLLETFRRLDGHYFKEREYQVDVSNKSLLKDCWPLKLIYHYFFWSLINILGYRPELYHCPLCQKKLKPENLHFSFSEGGIICQACFNTLSEDEKKECFSIKPDVVKVIRLILEEQWSFLEKLGLREKEKIAVDSLLNIFS